jgi:predicted RNA binding protein YcfA (HicA-like mRNA interferase family)
MVPPVSGGECARVLRRAGFQLERDGPNHVLARRDGAPAIRVPLVERLRCELLVSILQLAGLTRVGFMDLLDE